MYCEIKGVKSHKTLSQLAFSDQLTAQVLSSHAGRWGPEVFSVQEQVVPATPIRSLG